MAADLEDVKTKHPEFADVDDDWMQLFLDEALLRVSATEWGTKTDLGVIELTAHLTKMAQLAQAGSGAAGQTVVSESVGSISRSYSSPSSSASDGSLGSTVYGRSFIALRKEVFSGRVI